MFLLILQLLLPPTVWYISCCSKLFHLILTIFSQMRKQRLTQLKRGRAMVGIQFPQPPKASAINHAASNLASPSSGAGVPELLSAACPSCRQGEVESQGTHDKEAEASLLLPSSEAPAGFP